MVQKADDLPEDFDMFASFCARVPASGGVVSGVPIPGGYASVEYAQEEVKGFRSIYCGIVGAGLHSRMVQKPETVKMIQEADAYLKKQPKGTLGHACWLMFSPELWLWHLLGVRSALQTAERSVLDGHLLKEDKDKESAAKDARRLVLELDFALVALATMERLSGCRADDTECDLIHGAPRHFAKWALGIWTCAKVEENESGLFMSAGAQATRTLSELMPPEEAETKASKSRLFPKGAYVCSKRLLDCIASIKD